MTIHIAYYYLMINAYRSGDLSLVYPLMRGVAPLITGVLGIVTLREMPGALNWLGMLLIAVAAYLLAWGITGLVGAWLLRSCSA